MADYEEKKKEQVGVFAGGVGGKEFGGKFLEQVQSGRDVTNVGSMENLKKNGDALAVKEKALEGENKDLFDALDKRKKLQEKNEGIKSAAKDLSGDQAADDKKILKKEFEKNKKKIEELDEKVAGLKEEKGGDDFEKRWQKLKQKQFEHKMAVEMEQEHQQAAVKE
jgi:hypothetical protein